MTTTPYFKHLHTVLKRFALAVAMIAGFAISNVQALTTTQTFNLGTSPASTNFPTTGASSLIVWIPKGSLPPGSILRSVTANNLKLESQLGNSWASDLGVFIDPTPETPGGDGLLSIGDDTNYGGSANEQGWGGGQADGPFPSLSRNETNWTPAIDLHDAAVMLGNGWADDTAYSGTITIEYDASVPAVILNFGPGASVGELVANAANIAWTVPFGTNVTTLAPTFTISSGTSDKDNGGPTTYDFTNPVTYTVTDGATVNVYTVTVTVTPASSNKDILAFGPNAVISGTDIAWTVPFGNVVTNLAPTYTVSTFASGSPVSGTTRNFTSPQTYTITAQDLTTQDYTVTVTVAPDDTTVTWNLAGGGAWDSGALNWTGQTSGLPTIYDNGDHVIFDKTNGGTISIAAGILPLSTTVSATSGSYTFGGQPIGSGPLIKSGGGRLNLTTSPGNFSSIAVNGGTLFLDAANGFASGGALFVIPNTTVEAGARVSGWRAHSTSGTLTMNGGTYVEENGFGGSWAGPVVLTADSVFGAAGESYFMTLSGQISGPGGLTKDGGGILRLTASNNTYSGPTNVTSAFLHCDTVNSLGRGPLSISGTGKVNLSYIGTKVISSLTLGGVPMTTPGTYGATGSGADFIDDTYFGSTTIFGVPYPSTGTVTVNPYAAWADGEPFDGDKNADGVKNGQAFLLGAANPDENAIGRLPVPTKTAAGLQLTYSVRKPANRGAAVPTVQWSNDLGLTDPWTSNVSAVPASTSVVNGVDFQIDSSGALDAVIATIPATEAADGKLFGRLSGQN